VKGGGDLALPDRRELCGGDRREFGLALFGALPARTQLLGALVEFR
jgi:hypothetical protein